MLFRLLLKNETEVSFRKRKNDTKVLDDINGFGVSAFSDYFNTLSIQYLS